MIELGETLRKTREAKGLSPSQIAQTTHLLVQQIDAIEREDFSKIAAPIYGRGFVKLYCEALGLEPKPFVDAFMEIYSGNRQPSIKMRAPRQEPPPTPPEPAQPVAAPEPPEQPAPEQPAAPFPTAQDYDAPAEPQRQSSFVLEQETIKSPEASRGAGNALGDGFDFDTPTPSPRPLSRYSTPTPIDEDRRAFGFNIPPIVWRLLALGAVAVVVLILIVTGIKALYRASMSASEGEGEAAETTELAEPTPGTDVNAATTPDVASPSADAGNRPKEKPTEREILTIPPLYID